MLREGLFATQMLGLAMTRYVWKLEPIASLPTRRSSRASRPPSSGISHATCGPEPDRGDGAVA